MTLDLTGDYEIYDPLLGQNVRVKIIKRLPQKCGSRGNNIARRMSTERGLYLVETIGDGSNSFRMEVPENKIRRIE